MSQRSLVVGLDAYLEVIEGRHHDLRVIRMKEVLQTASPSSKSSKHKSPVGDTLRARSGQGRGAILRDTRNHFDSVRECFSDDTILDRSRFLFIGRADSREEHYFFGWTRVFLVDLHNIQQAANAEELRSWNSGDSGIIDRGREIVGLQSSSKSADCDLAENAHRTSDFCFKDHTDRDAFSVQDGWGKNGLYRMANGMTEIDEVTETCLTLIDGNNMGFYGYRAGDDSQQEFLRLRACSLGASGAIQGGSLNGSEDLC